MTSIRATFTETTVSTLLVKPIVARGTIIAAPPARVRMAFTGRNPNLEARSSNTMLDHFPQGWLTRLCIDAARVV
jgi:hypothetical protein